MDIGESQGMNTGKKQSQDSSTAASTSDSSFSFQSSCFDSTNLNYPNAKLSTEKNESIDKTTPSESISESSRPLYNSTTINKHEAGLSTDACSLGLNKSQTVRHLEPHRKRPHHLDLSGSTASSLITKFGLRSPNSATVSTFRASPSLSGHSDDAEKSEKSKNGPTLSAKFPFVHRRNKTASAPMNAFTMSDLPTSVRALTPSEFSLLLLSSYEHQSDPSTPSQSGSDISLADAFPSPPSSIKSESKNELASSFHADRQNTSTFSEPQFNSKVFVVDTRPFAQYHTSRIQTAVSICIPSTLLKRPTYLLPKFADCMLENQRKYLKNLEQYDHIIIYDHNAKEDISTNRHSALLYTLLKFIMAEEVTGQVCYIRGGFHDFEIDFPELIDSRPWSLVAEQEKGLGSNGFSSEPVTLAPVLTGFTLPASSTKDGPIKAFSSNIRSAIEAYDYTVDTVDIKLPKLFDGDNDEISSKIFPIWLCDIIKEHESSKIVAQRFRDIEQAEKSRLQAAFGQTGSESDMAINALAGVELGTKNRYSNIWPFDRTRVRILNDLSNCTAASPSADYINASYVSATGSSRRYVATQGPLAETVEDFWKMIWDQRIPVIVMLTAEEEGGMLKCDPYWVNFGLGRRRNLNLRMTEQNQVSLDTLSDTKVIVRKFVLSLAGSNDIHHIVQIQYTDWPDLGSPASPQDILALCRLKNHYVNQWRSEHDKNFNSNMDDNEQQARENNESANEEPLVLIHCSAGCGRTGTFCAIDSAINIFDKYCNKGEMPPEDVIFQTVHDLRSKRISMVQNLRQYALCYETIMLWCARKAGYCQS